MIRLLFFHDRQNEIEQDNTSILVKWEAFNMFRYHTEVQVVGKEAEEFGKR